MFMFWRLRMGLMVMICGGLLMYYGVQEWHLRAASSAAPEELTLEQLIARGPDGNPNVSVRDFALGDNYTFIEDESGDYWTKLLIPAVPKTMGNQSAHILNPRVIVKSTHVRSEDEIGTLSSRTRMQGMVVNRIEKLSGEEKGLLLQDYPGLDFNKCLILEESRQPSDAGKVFLIGGGGLALLLGGGVLATTQFSRA